MDDVIESKSPELTYIIPALSITYRVYGKIRSTIIAGCPNPNCCSDKLNLGIHLGFDYVYCKSCGMQGPVHDGHPDDSIEDWNSIKRQHILIR